VKKIKSLFLCTAVRRDQAPEIGYELHPELSRPLLKEVKAG